MKNDFDMLTYKFKDPRRIIPIADVHCGSINFNINLCFKLVLIL